MRHENVASVMYITFCAVQHIATLHKAVPKQAACRMVPGPSLLLYMYAASQHKMATIYLADKFSHCFRVCVCVCQHERCERHAHAHIRICFDGFGDFVAAALTPSVPALIIIIIFCTLSFAFPSSIHRQRYYIIICSKRKREGVQTLVRWIARASIHFTNPPSSRLPAHAMHLHVPCVFNMIFASKFWFNIFIYLAAAAAEAALLPNADTVSCTGCFFCCCCSLSLFAQPTKICRSREG